MDTVEARSGRKRGKRKRQNMRSTCIVIRAQVITDGEITSDRSALYGNGSIGVETLSNSEITCVCFVPWMPAVLRRWLSLVSAPVVSQLPLRSASAWPRQKIWIPLSAEPPGVAHLDHGRQCRRPVGGQGLQNLGKHLGQLIAESRQKKPIVVFPRTNFPRLEGRCSLSHPCLICVASRKRSG